MMFMEPKYTRIKQVGDGYRVDTIDPCICYMRTFKDRENAELAQECVEIAIRNLTWEGIDLDVTYWRAHRKLRPGCAGGKPKARPKLGIIKGGKE